MNKQENNRCRIYFGLTIVLILICSGIIYYKMPKRYCHVNEYIEKLVVDKDTHFKDYSINTKIMCEDGVGIRKYWGLSVQKIYGCLEFKEGKCLGYGKTCLIKIKEKVCEVK